MKTNANAYRERRRRGRPQIEKTKQEQAQELKLNGLTERAIADTLNIANSTAHKYSKGIKAPPQSKYEHEEAAKIKEVARNLDIELQPSNAFGAYGSQQPAQTNQRQNAAEFV
jgi:DNA invertase Pin-like site-specific DNA recombinase